RGRIRVGPRWLPFNARQVLAPHRGFLWAARVAGLIAGSDRYVDGAGALAWKMAGLVTIAAADGPDVSKSAVGRAGAEAIWLPSALLPRYGVRWSADGDRRITAHYALDDVPLDITYDIDADGRVASFAFDRWGDPDTSGTWGWHPFGGYVTGHRTFGGLTVPSRGSAGWSFGTPGWPAGEFFRYEITGLRPLPDPRG
ncbi:MAG: DUF6544 family protein, partial [Actinomycetota bacterium]